MIELKVITYEEDRMNYFLNQREKLQKKYDRLDREIKDDEPYFSERRILLDDYVGQLSFLDDVIKMLEILSKNPGSNKDIIKDIKGEQ